MTRNDVLERLCILCDDVSYRVFKHGRIFPCFCKVDAEGRMEYDEYVIEWIEDAVLRMMDIDDERKHRHG